jgi:hypothetical protein
VPEAADEVLGCDVVDHNRIDASRRSSPMRPLKNPGEAGEKITRRHFWRATRTPVLQGLSSKRKADDGARTLDLLHGKGLLANRQDPPGAAI